MARVQVSNPHHGEVVTCLTYFVLQPHLRPMLRCTPMALLPRIHLRILLQAATPMLHLTHLQWVPMIPHLGSTPQPPWRQIWQHQQTLQAQRTRPIQPHTRIPPARIVPIHPPLRIPRMEQLTAPTLLILHTTEVPTVPLPQVETHPALIVLTPPFRRAAIPPPFRQQMGPLTVPTPHQALQTWTALTQLALLLPP